MIDLFTDFGNAGPYVGQMKAVLCQQAPGRTLIDLFADAPRQNPRAAAYLLAAYVDEFPKESVFLCVVDPGVGDPARRPPSDVPPFHRMAAHRHDVEETVVRPH